jgi:hypothetical protein
MLLELINSLGATFIYSEVILHNKDLDLTDLKGGKEKLLRFTVLFLVVANIVLSENVLRGIEALTSVSAGGVHSLRDSIHGFTVLLAAPFHWASNHAGSSLVILLVLSLVALAIFSAKFPDRAWRRRDVLGALSTAGIMYGAALYFNVNGHIRHTATLKILVIIVSYTAISFLDCKRFCRDLTFPSFMSELSQSMLYVVPMCPCVAVGISTVFFVLVSVIEALHFDPHCLNSAVYYGTMYGPVVVLYFDVKRRCLRGCTALPVRAQRTKAEVAALRLKALSR